MSIRRETVWESSCFPASGGSEGLLLHVLGVGNVRGRVGGGGGNGGGVLQMDVELSEISSKMGIGPGIHYWHAVGGVGSKETVEPR